METVKIDIEDLKNGIEKTRDIKRTTEAALKNAKDMQQMLVLQGKGRPHQDQRDNILNIRNLIIDLDTCIDSIEHSEKLLDEFQRKVEP